MMDSIDPHLLSDGGIHDKFQGFPRISEDGRRNMIILSLPAKIILLKWQAMTWMTDVE